MRNIYKKSLTILGLVLTVLMLSSAVKSPYFSRTVMISRIYPHRLGYKVIYYANDMEYKSVYLPSKLFEAPTDPEAERSRIFEGHKKSYPYMAIFWKDGEFSHIKLYVKPGYSDISWGSFNNPDEHDEYFENADLKFEF